MRFFYVLFIFTIFVFTFAIDNFAGNCLELDGSDDYVDIGNDTSLDVGNTLTIEAWIYPTDLSGRYGVFSTRKNANTGAFQIEVGTGNNGTNTVAISGHMTWVIQSQNNVISANEWTHIAYTRSGTGTGSHKLYVNGVEQTLVTSNPYDFIDNTSSKVIASGTSGGQLFHGKIDEVRLWNIVRTEQEINDYMNTPLVGSETGLVSYWQYNESSGTTASDGVGSNDGTLNNMTTDDWVNSEILFGIPSLTTTTATSITRTTAESGGEVTFSGGSSVTDYGVCWSTSANPTIGDSYTTDGSGTGSFTSSITGLTASTTYHYRAYATNDQGTGYGDELTFETLEPVIPTVTTTTASSITQTTASSGGNVTSNGGANITERGVCWSTSENPTISDSHTSDGTGTGSFTSNITGLTNSTTYYYRAYATNSAGTGYGNISNLEDNFFITNPLGVGTSEEPYQISNLSGLRWLSKTTEVWDDNAYFLQTADIDATATQNWAGIFFIGSGFRPIGSSSVPFTGHYEGSNKIILNLYMNPERYTFTIGGGLFQNISDAVIQNLGIENVNLTAELHFGALVGRSTNSLIDNCYSSGTVIGDISVSGDHTGGGLVGYNAGTISNCYSYAIIGGDITKGGGLVGTNIGSILNCYSIGSIVGSYDYVGGFAGLNDEGGYIENCFSTGNVTGSSKLGGFVGTNDIGASIENCYSTGSVLGSGVLQYHIGGFSGVNSGTITDCHSSGSVESINYVGGFAGYQSNGYIDNCYSTSNVIGEVYIGGFVGQNSSYHINNCFSTGSVEGDQFVGGFVGSTYDGINYCYSTGLVVGNTDVGGFAGHTSYLDDISNCFWNTQTSGQSTSAGGTGKISLELKATSTFTDTGWDFAQEEPNGLDDHWIILSTLNTGYPILTWYDDLFLADFIADTTSVPLETEISFSDRSYGSPTQWQWDFDNDGNYDSSEQNPTHTYITPGTYSVKLTVSDGRTQDTFTKTNYITISQRNDFSVDNAEITLGSAIQFTDMTISSPTQWQWDFDNDGTYDSSVQNPSYIYPFSGIYSVKLTVSSTRDTTTFIREDFIHVNNNPESPQNVQVIISGIDAVISWDEVTQDIDGIPINLDGYIIRYNEVNSDESDYYFLAYVPDGTSFTHAGLTLTNSQMFYQVYAYKSYNRNEIEYLKEMNKSRNKIQWNELERNLGLMRSR